MQNRQQNPHVSRFKDFVRAPHHPCAMAKSVVARNAVEFGQYAALGDAACARSLCQDLYRALADVPGTPWSFVALFPDEEVADEADFENRLWRHLQLMHDFDARRHAWDRSVSRDPQDATFSFSIGGRAWYVIGMHPRASRHARRMPHVTLVFNPHAQFEMLRERGKYTMLRDQIRQRDIRLQGSINPMLADHGDKSEARQYSGRAVPADWRCPFSARNRPRAQRRGAGVPAPARSSVRRRRRTAPGRPRRC